RCRLHVQPHPGGLQHQLKLDQTNPTLETGGLRNGDSPGADWLRTGDFTSPNAPDMPMGRRVPSASGRPRNRLDAQYLRRGSGSDVVQLINRSGQDLFDLNSPNVKDFNAALRGFPVSRLPASKSVSLRALLSSSSPDRFDLLVTGRTEENEEFTETLFLDLNG
ncbi:hypothetical protein ACK280_26430, partial [Mycobacterium sherrisii]